jgi:hypothetical protein
VPPTSLARLELALRLFRVEGPRSFVERWRDRRLDARRSRRFGLAGPGAREAPGGRSETLWVLPFPLQRRRGGAAIQLLVRLEEAARSGPVALFQVLAGRFRCELWGAGIARPLAREWPLTETGWLATLLEAARWAGASRLHFESLIGLPLELPLELSRHGLAFGCSAHDFGLFCPRPHLLEEPSGDFCGFSTDPVRCARCLSSDRPVPVGFQEERRGLAARLIAAADRLEFPSEYMRREHLRLFPAMDPARTAIVVPRSLAENPPSPLRPVARPPRKIAYAGAVHRHKGAVEFETVVERLTFRLPNRFAWHVFGGGELRLLRRLRRLPRTTVHGYYRAGTLPSRLASAEIDLVLLPSIWPEAHCLVLDECAAAGVPVLAFDLGAPAERIRREGLGDLVDPEAGAAGLATWIAGHA